MTSLPDTLKPLLLQSTAHGIPRAARGPSLFRRVFWVVIFVVCFLSFIVQTAYLCARFFRFVFRLFTYWFFLSYNCFFAINAPIWIYILKTYTNLCQTSWRNMQKTSPSKMNEPFLKKGKFYAKREKRKVYNSVIPVFLLNWCFFMRFFNIFSLLRRAGCLSLRQHYPALKNNRKMHVILNQGHHSIAP